MLLVAGCGCAWPGSGGGHGGGGDDDPEGPGPDDAAFVERGPFDVGVRTLQLDGRKAEVFYPSAEPPGPGHAKVAYDLRDGLSEALLGVVPESLIIPIEVDAYRDLPVSDDGPFPVVLFSHGKGGWRTVNATLLSDIASWGFVVASTDHLERNLGAAVTNQVHDNADYGASFMATTLERVLDEGEDGGLFAGAIDGEHVAAVGHSAGGGAAMALSIADDRVDVVVSWAASGPVELAPTPFMVIAAAGDPITSNLPNDLTRNTGPTRVVELQNSGHAVFTDVCPGITTPDGLYGRFQSAFGLSLPPEMTRLLTDGCEEGDTPVTDAWPTILHFTVAQLREAFDIGPAGAGLGPGVVENLPAEVTYEELNRP